MIKSVEITNFRGVKHLTIDFQSRISIIKGYNALGKSTIINALNWLLTDSLFSDTDDIIDSKGKTSVKPISYKKGDVVEVKITTEGKSFTKQMKATYEKNSNDIKSHKTEYKMNDVKLNNANEFYEEVYKEFNFAPKVVLKDIREVSMLIDPLYALLKLDAKRLRALLVELGCNIDDEQTFINKYSEWLKSNINNYRGISLLDKCISMKLALKVKLKEMQANIDTSTALLEKYNDISDDAQSKIALDQANAKRDSLVSLIATINSESNDEVNKLLDERFKVLGELMKLKDAHSFEKQEKKESIEAKYAIDKNQIISEFNEELERWKTLENQLLKVKNDVELMQKNVELSIVTKNQELETLNRQLKMHIQNKSNAVIELNDIQKSVFKGWHVCPVCDEHFVDDEDKQALANFENRKAESIKITSSSIDFYKSKEQETSAKIVALNEDIKALQQRQIELNRQFLEFKTAYSEFIVNTPKPDFKEKLTKLENERTKALEMNNLRSSVEDEIDKLADEVKNIDAKLDVLKNAEEENKNARKQALREEITACDAIIADCYKVISKYQTKREVQTELDKVVTLYNDCDYHLQEVSEVIRAIIAEINNKALKLVGIQFVMLEENISNDGYTEVCYATDANGVKFEHINTKEKLFFGLTFCEKLRSILHPNCKLPYLVDKLEQLGDINELTTLQCYQLIGTKVSSEKQLTMQYLD